MERIKKNFGFGFMRLPIRDGEVDIAETNRMVDAFLDAGFNYFDTAHGYLQGKSEKTLKTCLTSRYLRDRYILTDKLTENFFKTEADIRPVFESQLEACGVDYFDFYLMHSQCSENYGHFKACRAYETAFALKEEGKVRHVGISFHGRPELLEQILTEYPAIEVVQIQFNYVDYDDPSVQSRKCYAGRCTRCSGCPAWRQPGQLCHPLRCGLPRHADGALRYEHARAGAGQYLVHEGLQAAG